MDRPSVSATGILSVEEEQIDIGNDSGAPVPVTSPAATVKGYDQLTSLSTAKTLAQGGLGAVPTGATYAIIEAETQTVRWRDDGTSPTASVGMSLSPGSQLFYDGNLAAIKFIETTASAKLNVSYYA